MGGGHVPAHPALPAVRALPGEAGAHQRPGANAARLGLHRAGGRRGPAEDRRVRPVACQRPAAGRHRLRHSRRRRPPGPSGRPGGPAQRRATFGPAHPPPGRRRSAARGRRRPGGALDRPAGGGGGHHRRLRLARRPHRRQARPEADARAPGARRLRHPAGGAAGGEGAGRHPQPGRRLLPHRARRGRLARAAERPGRDPRPAAAPRRRHRRAPLQPRRQGQRRDHRFPGPDAGQPQRHGAAPSLQPAVAAPRAAVRGLRHAGGGSSPPSPTR